jgi:fructokinase
VATEQHTIVGLGELLWDCLPQSRQIGGAPANFAYISAKLGGRALIASRVGNDADGAAIRLCLGERGLELCGVQYDERNPTSRVDIVLDDAGQPTFVIHENVAWDYLAWTPEWEAIARQADAVCFGSLAQRSPIARATIRRFVAATRPAALRVFDVNMRQAFFSEEIVRASLEMASIAKFNHEELPRVAALLGTGGSCEKSQAKDLTRAFGLRLVCVTRGAGGSLLVTQDDTHEQPGEPAVIADTVGAGDAFTATLTYCLLRGDDLPRMNRAANRVAAWVASHSGGMPPVANGDILRFLE